MMLHVYHDPHLHRCVLPLLPSLTGSFFTHRTSPSARLRPFTGEAVFAQRFLNTREHLNTRVGGEHHQGR